MYRTVDVRGLSVSKRAGSWPSGGTAAASTESPAGSRSHRTPSRYGSFRSVRGATRASLRDRQKRPKPTRWPATPSARICAWPSRYSAPRPVGPRVHKQGWGQIRARLDRYWTGSVTYDLRTYLGTCNVPATYLRVHMPTYVRTYVLTYLLTCTASAAFVLG